MPYEYIQLRRGGGAPLYQQLYEQLRDAMEGGRLRPGQKLPSIRRLCEDLGLSRTTVEGAYQQLCLEGYLQARPQRGYFVLTGGGRRAPLPQRPRPQPAPAPLPRYNLGTDAVDSACADLKAWGRRVREVLSQAQALVRYGQPQGEPALREALRDYSYRTRGVVCDSGQIVIGAGTQPLLALLCGLLQKQASAVALEAPGFAQAEQVCADCGIRVLRLAADRHGLLPQALRDSGATVALVSPSNRPADGSSIPLLRRQELLRWAKDSGGLLIEDDYNGELRYQARPIPAMQGMAAGARVVYLGSFSKLLLPSVRVGYMVLPQDLLARYRQRAAHYNQTASKTEQLALAAYISSGQMERQLRRLRKVYAEKSAALLQALRAAFGSRASLCLHETPLFVSLRLHAPLPPARLAALALEGGVRVQPGPAGDLRLSFAGIPLQEIPAAVAALAAAWPAHKVCPAP